MPEEKETKKQEEKKPEEPKKEAPKKAPKKAEEKKTLWTRSVCHRREIFHTGDEVSETDPAELKRLKQMGLIE